jgi:hypothetical protein
LKNKLLVHVNESRVYDVNSRSFGIGVACEDCAIATITSLAAITTGTKEPAAISTSTTRSTTASTRAINSAISCANSGISYHG